MCCRIGIVKKAVETAATVHVRNHRTKPAVNEHVAGSAKLSPRAKILVGAVHPNRRGH